VFKTRGPCPSIALVCEERDSQFMDDDNPKNKCDEFINGSQNNRIMINDDVQNPG